MSGICKNISSTAVHSLRNTGLGVTDSPSLGPDLLQYAKEELQKIHSKTGQLSPLFI